MSAFSGSISALCDANAQVLQSCRTLLELNVSAAASGQLHGLGEAVTDLCAFLEAWLERAQSSALQENFGKVRGNLGDIYKIGITFRLVATLTAVNASSSATAMDGFVEELRAVPVQIRSAVDLLLERLTKVDIVVSEAVQTARMGLHALGQSRDSLVDQTDTTAAMMRQSVHSREAMEVLGNTFLGKSQEQTNLLIRGFQYSDFFAQRLDHVAQMLAQEDKFGPPVLLLASRQIHALAEDGRATVHDIEAAMQSQSATADQFIRDFGDQIRLSAEVNASVHEIFKAVMTSRATALPAISRSVSSSRLVLEEINLCNESFAKLVEMSGVMDLAAINARVRASREDRARAAMAFLSGAVTDGARACRDVLTLASSGLEKVARLQNPEMLDKLVLRVDRFSAAFDACQTGLKSSEHRAAQLGATLVEVSGLIDRSRIMLENCQQTAETLQGIVEALFLFAERLAAGAQVPKVWPDLSQIYETYSIQAERDTHDRLIGRQVSQAPPTKAPELDDIFF